MFFFQYRRNPLYVRTVVWFWQNKNALSGGGGGGGGGGRGGSDSFLVPCPENDQK